jgi:hypothetical protein
MEEIVAQANVSTSRILSPRAELRLVLAFFLLPPTAAVLMFVTSVALWGMGLWIFNGPPSIDGAIGMAFGVGILATATTAIVAVPAVAWQIHRRSLSFRALIVWGCVVGNVPFAIIVLGILATQAVNGTLAGIGRLWDGWYGFVRSVGLGLWFGVVLTAVLWMVAGRACALEIQDRSR